MEKKSKYFLRIEDGKREPIEKLVSAERIVIVDKDTVGAKEITFAYARFEREKGWHAKHTHPGAEEVIYILSGKGKAGVKDEERTVKEGDILWVPKGEVHWAYNPFEEPLEMLFLYTAPTLEEAGYQIVER